MLKSVFRFHKKVEEFISDKNQDNLFIVPVANARTLDQGKLEADSVQVVSLEQFSKLSPRDLAASKTILMVHEDELNRLVELFFQTPENRKPDIGPNPYRGLLAFREADADLFFGRDTYIDNLVEAVQRKPFVAVIGASGSGKSSLVYAGLIPRLRTQGNWQIVTFRPRLSTSQRNPFLPLASAIWKRLHPEADALEGFKKSLELAEYLKRGIYTLPQALDMLRELNPDASILLFADQFEEVYAKDVDPDDRKRFLNNLLDAADPSGHVSVILTLRSDFLGQTQSHPAFNKAVANHGVIVPVMDEAELRDAIAKPAEQAGHPLDDACVELLIEQTRGREGALPLLQFALTRIWEGLAEGVAPADTLKQIGGVGGALAGEAQRLYDPLSDADKAIARRAFLALVQLGEGTRDTRRRINLSDVVAHGENPAHVQAVISHFADPRARLVTLSADTDGTETAEVTHEALLEHWETLREWLDENREDLRFHRHLAADAAYWRKQGKPDGKLWRSPDLDLLRQHHQRAGQDMTLEQVEFFHASVRKDQHSKRVRRLAVTTLVVLTVIALGTAGLAWWAYGQVKRQLLISAAQSLVLFANQDTQRGERERAALLIRQAYLLNQKNHGPEYVNEQIDDALRQVFLNNEGKTADLIKEICPRATRNLPWDEWQQIANIPYEPCHDLPYTKEASAFPLRLRSTPLTTGDVQALSLNVRADGYPATDIANDFEPLGDVVIDHATGLMWQQSGSDNILPYDEAEEYIAHQLNRENFAGHADWRLPTIEELLSLLEKEKQEAFRLSEQHFKSLKDAGIPDDIVETLQPLQDEQFDKQSFINAIRQRPGTEHADDYTSIILELARVTSYIDPIFDYRQSWCWSFDLRQTKDESSPGSAWVVYFYLGYVYWYNLGNYFYDCVRAVRSR